MDFFTPKIIMFIIISALLAGLLGYIKYLKSSNDVLEREKIVLKQELGISQQSVKDLSAAIDKQNTAIQTMKRESDARHKKYLEDIAKAKKNSDNLKARAEELMKRKLPQNMNACNAANSLFIEELGNVKK